MSSPAPSTMTAGAAIAMRAALRLRPTTRAFRPGPAPRTCPVRPGPRRGSACASSRRASSGDRAARAQIANGLVVKAGAAQDLVTVLADTRRLARGDLALAIDPDRAADREHGVVLERHQHLVLDHLLVGRDIVENPDHAEHEPASVEDLAPFGQGPRCEHGI